MAFSFSGEFYTDGMGIVACVLLVAVWVNELAMLALLIARKRKQPLKQRSPSILYIMVAATLLWDTINCLRLIIGREQFTCSVYVLIHFICVPMYAMQYILRSLRLFLIWKQNSMKQFVSANISVLRAGPIFVSGSENLDDMPLPPRRPKSSLPEPSQPAEASEDISSPQLTDTSAAETPRSHKKVASKGGGIGSFLGRSRTSTLDFDEEEDDEMSEETVQQQESLRKIYSRISKLWSDRFLYVVFGVIMFIHLSTYAIAFADEDLRSSTGCNIPSQAVFPGVMLGINVVVYCLLFVIGVIINFKVQEEFSMRKELIVTMILWIVTYICFILWAFVPWFSNTAERYFSITVIMIFATLVDNWVSIGYPALLTFKHNNRQRSTTLIEDGTLGEATVDMILQDRKGKPLFVEYARREFSEENIKFLDELEAFRKIKRPLKKAQAAQNLYNLYIDSSGLLALNISGEVQQAMTERMEEWKPIFDTKDEEAISKIDFDKAFAEVGEAVKSALVDTFMRFRESTLFESWDYQRKSEKEMVEVMKQADMI